MRLLNVFTGRLEEYFGSEIPEYAILSHTWGQEEVTFVDIQNIPAGRKPISMLWKKKDSSSDREASPFVHDQAVQEKAGYKKIYYSCTQAAHDGYQYIWIDSCCIDKSSSAELSEAINSMFQWYEKASICYAYLEDVQLETFRNARWFTRGWTLQELLAPQNVVFMGEGWTLLGTKAELASSITAVTGIDPLPLLNRDQIRRNSVAQRMSWASKRNTTRVEDAAYCLLGIFDANMPLLYGEAEDAFVRLQEEILKYSDDQSLFAWSISPDYEIDLGCGIFAQSPQNYATHSPIISLPRTSGTVPFAMTNRGLQIELPLNLILAGSQLVYGSRGLAPYALVWTGP
ncbi:heterokaryon incompatibility protein-domain-containing protein [Xylogone sp. PMI_703]|nr:heterokaryon incompatibility protein-domain-containing protein [Xylogone sp. PMI_703]